MLAFARSRALKQSKISARHVCVHLEVTLECQEKDLQRGALHALNVIEVKLSMTLIGAAT
jgi:hypothetical protein